MNSYPKDRQPIESDEELRAAQARAASDKLYAALVKHHGPKGRTDIAEELARSPRWGSRTRGREPEPSQNA